MRSGHSSTMNPEYNFSVAGLPIVMQANATRPFTKDFVGSIGSASHRSPAIGGIWPSTGCGAGIGGVAISCARVKAESSRDTPGRIYVNCWNHLAGAAGSEETRADD